MTSSALAILLFLLLLLGAPPDCHAEIIAGYKPQSKVTDHAAIDLDQQLLQSLLAQGDLQGASLVYLKGAHSKSYASITLARGTGKINKNTVFVGTAIDGSSIRLAAYSDYEAGETKLKLRYVVQEDVFCRVGAHTEPVLDGCLTAVGTLKLDGIRTGSNALLSYSYDPERDNKNGRTLAGFSTAAENKMAQCGPSCPYTEYSKYYEYYGAYDYGHQYVTAALEQRATNFESGNVDFGTYSMPALQRAIQVATLNLNVWMYVLREYEDALDDCAKECALDQCNADKVNAWDEGVAFYAGSLEGPDGSSGQGVLSYALSDDLCVAFKTCGIEGTNVSGTSFVNSEIIRHSESAVRLLVAEECVETRVYVQKIVGLMTSTLVQALLKSAYDTSSSTTMDAEAKDVARGEAAAYAAAVLPLVHNCSAVDARKVSQHLDYNNVDRDYETLKALLEKHYDCMGITCEQVGGLWDSTTQAYRSGASPCHSAKEGDHHLAIVILGCALVGAVVLASVAYVAVQQKQSSLSSKQ